MRANLLRALLVAGILIDVGFLLINLSPARPHLSARRKAKVVMRASAARVAWVKQNQLDEFGAANDIDFEVVPAKSFEEVLEILRQEKAHPSGILLADIDDELADNARSEGLVRSVQSAASAAELAAMAPTYLPEAMSRATSDGTIWFIPKRALVDVAVWLKPAVEDAYLHWQELRPQIDAALKEANGVGLPASYQLEKSPDHWDTYDLFVAAWTWAHRPAEWAAAPGEAASTAPRMAFRTGNNEDATDDLFGAFFRLGMKVDDPLRLDARPVLDWMQWEALFRKHHLLAPECEKPEGIDSFGVNSLLHERKLAWAPIDQADSLWLHGGARRDGDAGMAGASDLAWSTMPAGASLEMDARREPARAGRSFSLEEVHFWTIPIHAPHPGLAFQLARFLTQTGLHQRETEAVGLLPVRQDLRDEYPVVFRLEWMQQMLDASYRQLDRGSGDLPDEVTDQGLDKQFNALRERVLSAPVEVTAAGVRARVQSFEKEAAHGR